MTSRSHESSRVAPVTEPRLDRMARHLSAARSRRAVTGGLAGAVGLLLGLTGPDAEAAWTHRPCPRPQVECGRRCISVERNRRHCGGCRIRCKKGQVCRKYRCRRRRRS